MEMPEQFKGLLQKAMQEMKPTDEQRLAQLQSARDIGEVRIATYKQVKEMIDKELMLTQTQVKCIDYEMMAIRAKIEDANQESSVAEHGPMPDGLDYRETVPMSPEVDGPLKED